MIMIVAITSTAAFTSAITTQTKLVWKRFNNWLWPRPTVPRVKI
jgi:hypothetical protein